MSPRHSPRSEESFALAQKVIPGGVSSPVRAFGLVDGDPLFITRGKGSRITDADGSEYIDYVCSWGASMVGHSHPKVVSDVAERAALGLSFGAPTELETQLASTIISHLPSMEMVRFVSSGTEACMSAVRLARAYGGRKKILKFEGHYHGHSDFLLAGAGSGLATQAMATSKGVTDGAIGDTLTIPFQNTSALRQVFHEFGGDLACVILEVIAGNCGFIKPSNSFLALLSELCQRHGVLLVADEVMTGFRVALGGAQSIYGLTPDITVLGKVIGGGLPLACYGGKRQIMAQVAPLGQMYQAGTLSGNPVAVQCGLTTLEIACESGNFEYLSSLSHQLVSGLQSHADGYGIPFSADSEGGMFGYVFSSQKPLCKQHIDEGSMRHFRYFFSRMLEGGIYLPPSPYEACFLSLAHTPEDISSTLSVAKKVFAELREVGWES